MIEVYFYLFLAILLGIFFGILTGLIPGLHINLIITYILANIFLLNDFFLNIHLVIFIISMTITHTFINFLPTLIFGLPSSDNALSLFPAQKLILEGKGYLAIKLSSIGSFFGIIFAIFLFPILYFSIEIVYEKIRFSIPYFLIFLTLLLIILEKNSSKRFLAFFVVLLASSLGLLTLNSYHINNPLLILFSGLFGLSFILNSLIENSSNVPLQDFNKKNNKIKLDRNIFKSICVGGLSGTFCSILPGIGNIQAMTISSLFFKSQSSKFLIVTISAINTINFIISILTFHLIEKTRNGAIFSISQILGKITISQIFYFMVLILFIGIICYFLTIHLGKFLLKKISNKSVKLLNYFILFFILILVFILDGFFGILILLTCAFLGILTINFNIKKIHLMSVLIVPIIFSLI